MTGVQTCALPISEMARFRAALTTLAGLQGSFFFTVHRAFKRLTGGLAVSGAESSGTSESLRMLGDEDCRTAGLGKTERPVGWEGNGELVMMTLMRHCIRGNPQKQIGVL